MNCITPKPTTAACTETRKDRQGRKERGTNEGTKEQRNKGTKEGRKGGTKERRKERRKEEWEEGWGTRLSGQRKGWEGESNAAFCTVVKELKQKNN
jgi:hypothetical protein